jgi:hypothetical protein
VESREEVSKIAVIDLRIDNKMFFIYIFPTIVAFTGCLLSYFLGYIFLAISIFGLLWLIARGCVVGGIFASAEEGISAEDDYFTKMEILAKLEKRFPYRFWKKM